MVRFWVADMVARALAGAFVIASILAAGSGEGGSDSRDADAAAHAGAGEPAAAEEPQ